MFSRHALWPRAQASQLFPEAGGAGDQQIAALGDPVAGGELEEQRPVEPARVLIVDVLDAGAVAQFGGAGAGLELLLPAQGRFIFQQQSEPFGVIEAARLGLVFEVLEPLGEAVEAERVQLVERGMGEHGKSLSVVVAGAAQIGVVEERGRAVVLAAALSALRASSAATPLQLRTPSSTARAETASRRATSRLR